MLEGINPVELIGVIVGLIGAIAAFITNQKLKRYLAVIQKFLNIVGAVASARVDGYTEDEYNKIGKLTAELAEEVNSDLGIPAVIPISNGTVSNTTN